MMHILICWWHSCSLKVSAKWFTNVPKWLFSFFSGWSGSQIGWDACSARVEALLLCVESSLGIWWHRHLVKMPRGCLPGKVFHACPTREETSRQTRGTLEGLCLLADLAMLLEVAGDGDWASWLRTLSLVSLGYKDLKIQKISKAKKMIWNGSGGSFTKHLYIQCVPSLKTKWSIQQLAFQHKYLKKKINKTQLKTTQNTLIPDELLGWRSLFISHIWPIAFCRPLLLFRVNGVWGPVELL